MAYQLQLKNRHVVCVCVFLCVCLSVCLSICVHDNSKNNGFIHLKLEDIVVYENSSVEIDIQHCPIKVKVFLHLPQYKLSGPTCISQPWNMLGNCD